MKNAAFTEIWTTAEYISREYVQVFLFGRYFPEPAENRICTFSVSYPHPENRFRLAAHDHGPPGEASAP
jgi:hypothetical protein